MIREYRTDDIEKILAIWLEASIIAHNFIESCFWESKMDDMRNLYLPSSITFVYVDDITEDVLGFISLVDDHIAAIFVIPSKQGIGIGKSLMNHAKSLYPRLSLSVFKDNNRSISFYKQQGFKISKSQVDETTGLEELVMTFHSN
ncbi:MAG: N-acetyltransferase [Tannerellaceae bacterium]